MARVTFNNVHASTIVELEHEGERFVARFEGFAIDEEDGDRLYDTLDQVKRLNGRRTNADLEATEDPHAILTVLKKDESSDHADAAIRRVAVEDYRFEAYLFNGRWCAGSDATPIRIVSWDGEAIRSLLD